MIYIKASTPAKLKQYGKIANVLIPLFQRKYNLVAKQCVMLLLVVMLICTTQIVYRSNASTMLSHTSDICACGDIIYLEMFGGVEFEVVHTRR